MALSLYYAGTQDDLNSVTTMFERVAELDPNFALAYTMGAAARIRLFMHYGNEAGRDFLEEAEKKLSVALDLDPQDAMCHCVKGMWHTVRAETELAIGSLTKAIELAPSSAEAHFFNAMVLHRAGLPEQALNMVDRAINLSPNDTLIAGFQVERAACLFDLEQYEMCADWAQRALHSPNPRPRAYAILAAALVFLDRHDEAKSLVAKLKSQFRNFSIASYLATRGAKDIGHERLVEALRKTGLIF